MSDICTACGQAIPGKRGRVCSLCDRPIGAHHKWRFVDGRAQHKNCNDPELYRLAKSTQASLLEE